MQSLVDFVKLHKTQIGVFGLTTLAFHIVRKWKEKQKQKHRESLKGRLIRKKTKIYTQSIYDNDFKIPRHVMESQNSLIDQIKYLNTPLCKIESVPHLMNTLEMSSFETIKSPLLGQNKYRDVYGGKGFIPKQGFIYKGSFVLQKNNYCNSQQLADTKYWLLAGPRRNILFKPKQVKAAIVTCGGLCPGLNVVIRQLFITLNILYGCPEIWGIKFGYMGFYTDQNWIRLTFSDVNYLQHVGGTFLGSSRGGFDSEKGDGQKIVDAMIKKGINQVYIIGGDGTHRGILTLCNIIQKRKVKISIVGIPKTIDNDIPIIDKSFGFETAVSESIRAIRSAYVESRGVNYGIGLVKLMGRDAGFIAMDATNASRDVDICLIPQFKFDLYGEFGVLQYVYKQLQAKKHMVIVVAEGAGSGVSDLQQLKSGIQKDKSGNVKLPDIGGFLKSQIVKYCKNQGLEATLKYIDPAYMIRTVPANNYDRRMCGLLASSAVHGAMAGFTSFTVGLINNTPAMIPITSIGKPSRVTKQNRGWQRLLAGTQQPSFQKPIIEEKP